MFQFLSRLAWFDASKIYVYMYMFHMFQFLSHLAWFEDTSKICVYLYMYNIFQFLSRLAWFEDASKRHQEEVYERTMRQVQEDIEKKLAGQHKLSKKEEEIYDAMKGTKYCQICAYRPLNAGKV